MNRLRFVLGVALIVGTAAILAPAALTTAQPPSLKDDLKKENDDLKARLANLEAIAAKQDQPAVPAPPVPPVNFPPVKKAKGGINLATNTPFPRGMKATPKHVLMSAPQFKPAIMAPAQYAVVPSKLSMWGNNQYGDCVTAEEAFKEACKGHFISESEVIRWAKAHNVLNGANLQPVIRQMQTKGFSQDGNFYNDGKESTVDYSNQSILKAAIALGPVKIGLDANALPPGAGNKQGWYDFGGQPGEYDNEDHCTGFCGYGTAKFCFDSLHLPIPAGVDPNKPDCYLHFTWSTIGVVDHPWIMSCVSETWVRDPSSVIVGTGTPTPDPPLDPPGPPPPPIPTGGDIVVSDGTTTATFKNPVTITAKGSAGSGLTPEEIEVLRAILDRQEAGGADAPVGFVDDPRVHAKIKAALTGNDLARYERLQTQKFRHRLFMNRVARRMAQDQEGAKLLDEYKAGGALPDGFLNNLADFIIKILPAILQILALFGL